MKKIFNLTTILLVFALVICTCAFCLVGCNFVKDPTEDSTEEVQSGLKLEVEDSSELSISLTPIEPEEYEAYGVSMAAESAYTLTATGAPSFTTYSNVTWMLLCEGVWASGKTLSDYVTLETNGNTAVLTCLQPFGSQITIRCSSEYNNSLYAECKLDYVKRINSVKFTCASTGYYADSDYSFERMYYSFCIFKKQGYGKLRDGEIEPIPMKDLKNATHWYGFIKTVSLDRKDLKMENKKMKYNKNGRV